ncbi:hypothetical protein RvY_04539 [Ramazzottius varieornatus]|uniref:Nucleotide-diphospho-sugar transferase domain-containing protein n=1 Tax=Ramazzottius varieornatus TaxID=947166 RepID=A0A1D1USL1_RAMVA|nr:hypothetical protein RvY_04539 [Ramazzottius varieornatus]
MDYQQDFQPNDSPSDHDKLLKALIKASITVFFVCLYVARYLEVVLNNPSSFDDGTQDELIVHYVKLYTENLRLPFGVPPSPPYLSFLECISILSVMMSLQPVRIYIHTNMNFIWPANSCRKWVTKWPPFHIVYSPLRKTIGSQNISIIHHEADLRKLEAVRRYGGLFIDFDVLVLDGKEIRRQLAAHPCIICDENNPVMHSQSKVNAGFFGCLRPNAEFPRRILQESYEEDYQAAEWTYNSGVKPTEILEKHPGMAVYVDGVCNNPSWRSKRRLNGDSWSEKMAFHHFTETDNFLDEQHLAASNTRPLKDVVYFICARANVSCDA